MKSTPLFSLLSLCLATANALDYPYTTAEPQKTGWPLTDEERAYVLKPEFERRPGSEQAKHQPTLWPVVPSAGSWGGTSWLDTHSRLVEYVKANAGPVDVLLVGDSITQQWGSPLDQGRFNEAWKKHFGGYKTINIGIGGDKAQNVLWRLDHGGVEGLQPRVVIVMIGNNNMFFAPETGVEAAAKGAQLVVANVREKFPLAEVVAAKILPCHAPGNLFYENIKRTNAALDALSLAADPKVHVLDLWRDFLNADGTLNQKLFQPDNIHLSPEGYGLYSERLKPLLGRLLGPEGIGGEVVIPAKKDQPAAQNGAQSPATSSPKTAAPAALGEEMLRPTAKSADGRSLIYPYGPYNESKLDPQTTGWPLTAAEVAWVKRQEYFRKPGHEAQKHLPEMWFVTPTAGFWQAKDGSEANAWVEHHAANIAKVQAAGGDIDIALLGDSITQGWGGGWDGAPFNAAWQRHCGTMKTVNLGIAGDRMEQILWRLDHGALDAASPRVIVLMIGVNNAPLVHGNGVPAASAAHGIKLCIENLRLRCPKSRILLVKILPAFNPGADVGARVREINDSLDTLQLDADTNVRVLDLWREFTQADGSLKTELYADKHLHLGPDGYESFATALKPAVGALLGKPNR
jgi:lysophospholipase L1-like esterase